MPFSISILWQVLEGRLVPDGFSYSSAFLEPVQCAVESDDVAGSLHHFLDTLQARVIVASQSTMPLTGGRSRTHPLSLAPSHEQGHGKIQLTEVLFVNVSSSTQARITTGSELWLRDNEAIPHSGVMRYVFAAAANSRAKVTLAWTDPAASPLADVALVNDLDLVRCDYITSTFDLCIVCVSSKHFETFPQVVVRNRGFNRGNARLFENFGGRDFLNNQVQGF